MARALSPSAMSPSPQPQPLTKRDKRRNIISERLQEMISAFSQDTHQHYRAQLQAIQVDMNLVLKADLYENKPLEDSPQAIEDLINALTQGNVPAEKAAKDDYLAMAGKRYYEFCQEINKSLEQRDADLTALKNRYDNSMNELERVHNYKIQVAQREHYELATTIRQRLLNSVTKKRDRLLREKEQMDIADSNSIFLNPAHFTLNVPNSPGGPHGNRKTRHTRHRMGEVEEPVNERGRKRKLPGDEEGNESPVPGFRTLGNDGYGGNSPYWDQRGRTIYAQQEAPAYSIERIFTEKELTHAANVAQLATQRFFLEQQQGQEAAAAALTNGQAASVPSIDGSTEALTAATAAPEGEDVPTPALAAPSPLPSQQALAPEMERQVSYHATRGATKANPLSFLSEAAEALSAPPVTNLNRFLPIIVPITKTDKGAPTPPCMKQDDIMDDLTLMLSEEADRSSKGRTNGHVEDDDSISAMRTKYLEQACRETLSTGPFRMPLTDVGPAYIKDTALRPAHFGFADAASVVNGVKEGVPAPPPASNLTTLASALRGGEPMSRATSMGGASDMGASDIGGVGMRRTRSRLV